MKLKGIAETGGKNAQKFLSLEPYREKIREKLGFSPFPGTLNLRVDVDEQRELKASLNSKRIEGFDFEGEEYGGLDLYPVEVEGIEAALLDIDRGDHGDEVAELIAEEKLRAELGIEDGDEVKIDG